MFVEYMIYLIAEIRGGGFLSPLQSVIMVVVSAITGGLIWDLLKFPITSLITKLFNRTTDEINGYWIGHANSQKSKDLFAKELLHINLANTTVKGHLYQLTSKGRYSRYSIIGFSRQGMLSMSYEISSSGIQTGTFNLKINNSQDQHLGTLDGVYTEFYDTPRSHLSASYVFYRIEVPTWQQILLHIKPFCICCKTLSSILANYPEVN